MAHYSEMDYRSEVERRAVASPGHCHGAGGAHYVVKKEAFEEVDDVHRAGRAHHGHGHGGHHHGHGAGHLEARASRFEERVDTADGECYERKDSYMVNAA